MLNSFKLKLVAYFVLLSLLPMAAAFWGFTTVAGLSKTRQVDARLQAGLRATLAAYQERLANEETAAQALANLPAFQRALERHDRVALTNLLREAPDISVTTPDGFRMNRPPELAVQQSVYVVTRRGLIGTVDASLALDDTLVAGLRAGSGLESADALALLRGGRVIAAEPFVRGRVDVEAGQPTTQEVGGTGYRLLRSPELADTANVSFAVLSPKSLIDAADATSRNRLLLGLLAVLALVSVAAYLEGRSIVRTLRALAEAARGIARGRFAERVPVRGRDEFAVLGTAFNEMAAQLEERLAELDAERRRLAESVTRFGTALASTHDVDRLLELIAETALEATGAAGARISVGRTTAVAGDPDAPGEPLELPIEVAGESLGMLALAGGPFEDDQRDTARSLAWQAAVALENARLHRLVERQALVDGLTGVANRRRIEEALQAEIARAERFGGPLTLVLADLDDFKAVNDAHGHAAGDEALRAFADVLRETVRESDVAGRWGGEEFMLLLPGAGGDGAVQLAERIRLALAERPIVAAGCAPFRVTCSFGVAQHEPGLDAGELYAAADRALYRAKRGGKDRVERERLIRTF